MRVPLFFLLLLTLALTPSCQKKSRPVRPATQTVAATGEGYTSFDRKTYKENPGEELDSILNTVLQLSSLWEVTQKPSVPTELPRNDSGRRESRDNWRKQTLRWFSGDFTNQVRQAMLTANALEGKQLQAKINELSSQLGNFQSQDDALTRELALLSDDQTQLRGQLDIYLRSHAPSAQIDRLLFGLSNIFTLKIKIHLRRVQLRELYLRLLDTELSYLENQLQEARIQAYPNVLPSWQQKQYLQKGQANLNQQLKLCNESLKILQQMKKVLGNYRKFINEEDWADETNLPWINAFDEAADNDIEATQVYIQGLKQQGRYTLPDEFPAPTEQVYYPWTP